MNNSNKKKNHSDTVTDISVSSFKTEKKKSITTFWGKDKAKEAECAYRKHYYYIYVKIALVK